MKYVYSSIFQREFDDYITMRKAANMKIKDDAYTLASLDSFLVQQGIRIDYVLAA